MNGSFDSSIEEQAKKFDFEQASEVISAASGHEFNEAFLKSLGEDLVKQIQTEILNGTYTEKTWHDVTGSSFNVMKDMVDRKLTAENITNKGDNGGENFSVAFVGDILLDTNFAPMAHASKKGGVLNCIDTDLIKYLNSCDVFLINNEFSIGERGERINGKTWTFQVAPERIQIMKDLGADIVSLANNHALDFGVEALLDSFTTFDEAGIPYVGAGETKERAEEAIFVGDSDVDGPHTENSEILAAAYEKAGAPLLYIIKPGCDHHPHSLEDPTEICDFIDRYM